MSTGCCVGGAPEPLCCAAADTTVAMARSITENFTSPPIQLQVVAFFTRLFRSSGHRSILTSNIEFVGNRPAAVSPLCGRIILRKALLAALLEDLVTVAKILALYRQKRYCGKFSMDHCWMSVHCDREI